MLPCRDWWRTWFAWTGAAAASKPVPSCLPWLYPSRTPFVPILYPFCTSGNAIQCNVLTEVAVASKPRPVLSFLLLSPLNVPFFSVQALLSLPNYPFHTLATQRHGRVSAASTGAMQSSPIALFLSPLLLIQHPSPTTASVSVLPQPMSHC